MLAAVGAGFEAVSYEWRIHHATDITLYLYLFSNITKLLVNQGRQEQLLTRHPSTTEWEQDIVCMPRFFQVEKSSTSTWR